MKQYRHGDLLIVEVPICPKGTLLDHRILAHGEATGHAHRIDERAELRETDGQLYVRVEREARLTHEEHATITLPQGYYRVVRQREYTPAAPRWVED